MGGMQLLLRDRLWHRLGDLRGTRLSISLTEVQGSIDLPQTEQKPEAVKNLLSPNASVSPPMAQDQ